jgi:hypothetical protein
MIGVCKVPDECYNPEIYSLLYVRGPGVVADVFFV